MFFLAERNQQPPPLHNPAAAGIQENPSAPEDQPAAHNHEGQTEEDDQRLAPDRDVGRVLHGEDPDAHKGHKDADDQERDAEQRKAAAVLLNLKDVGCDLPVGHGSGHHADSLPLGAIVKPGFSNTYQAELRRSSFG